MHDKTATLYRMVMPEHVCSHGQKAKHLLDTQGCRIDDRWLKTRAETDAFKAEHDVKTPPQTFIGGERIGGHDDLRVWFCKPSPDPQTTSYTPVIAVLAMTATMALAAAFASYGTPLTIRAGEWFVAFSTCVLALLKLQDVERFSTMFVTYNLLARRRGCRCRSRCLSARSARSVW